MKIFYSISKKHLIVVPLRNGSTHLYENNTQYQLIDVTHPPIFNSIIDEVEKKTFIYRDPCIRLLSYYNNFIYKVYKDQIKISQTNLIDQEKREKLFKPTVRGNDVLSDITFASEKIRKNYKEDHHTRPQYDFFTEKEYYTQDIIDYEIVSVTQYTKWLFLTFGGKPTLPITSAINEVNITVGNFNQMQKIQELCNILYKDDYELLEPNVTYL